MEYGHTAYNRPIYASPPVGPLGLRNGQVIPLRSIPKEASSLLVRYVRRPYLLGKRRLIGG
jgi:hypothetical protein